MNQSQKKATLLAMLIALLLWVLLRRKGSQANPLPGMLPTPEVTARISNPDPVKARALGPAIYGTCPIGYHLEYAADGTQWCVQNPYKPNPPAPLSGDYWMEGIDFGADVD